MSELIVNTALDGVIEGRDDYISSLSAREIYEYAYATFREIKSYMNSGKTYKWVMPQAMDRIARMRKVNSAMVDAAKRTILNTTPPASSDSDGGGA